MKKSFSKPENTASSDDFKFTQKEYEKMYTSFNAVVKTIQSNFKNQMDNINLSTQQQIQVFYKEMKAVQLHFNEISLSVSQRLDASFKKFHSDLEKYSILLPKAGWVLPMTLNPTEIKDIIHDSCDNEAIDDYLYHFFIDNNKDQLSLIFKDFQSDENINQWKNLISECIWAFDNSHHIIAIPALLSILEGIIIKESFSLNILKKHNKKQRLTDVKHCCSSIVKKQNIEENPTADYLVSVCVWSSISEFINKLYAGGDFSIPDNTPSSLNRHYILHGRDKTDWEEKDAVRLFVCIHTIMCMLDDKEF